MNNCIFYMKSMDEKSTIQNFGPGWSQVESTLVDVD